MFANSKEVDQLLRRTALTASFSDFLNSLISTYSKIGAIQSVKPIVEGYEAANFVLICENGNYVLKIFESNRQKENISDLIKILVEAPKVGVPVLELIPNSHGDYFSQYHDLTAIPYYLTRFWNGEDYKYRTPQLEEMKEISEYLARLNTLTFPVTEAYDDWGNKNLAKEFDASSADISLIVKEKVAIVDNELRNLDTSNFSKSVIHGDMQRKHVLRNLAGQYCILDFGCMSHDLKVVDLSTYLAWFCLSEDNWHNRSQIMTEVIDVYLDFHPLSSAEIDSLPVLIRASYAAYYLKTSQLISQGDNSQETKDWHQQSESLLDLAKSL